MQQQPLAFTLVKTVVCARDQGISLSPALTTAWEMMRAELSPAHRVISDEVSWGPQHQEDLKFVIDAVRAQFGRDAALEAEFLAFLAEVEPYEQEDKRKSAMPLVSLGFGSTSIGNSKQGDSTNWNDELPTDSFTTIPETNELVETSSAEILTTLEVEHVVENFQSEVEHPTEFDYASQTEVSLEATQPAQNVEGVSDPAKVEVQRIEENKSSVAKTSFFGVAKPYLFALATILGIALLYLAGTAILVKSESPVENSTSEVVGNETIQSSELTPPFAELKLVKAIASEVDSLRAIGDYSGARTKQQEYINLLLAGNSTVQEKQVAYSTLAILFAAEKNPSQAIVEQRKALDLAYDAYGKDDVLTGRAHLTIGNYYLKTGELHMSRAHLRQARKIFGHAQDLASPTDLQQTQDLETGLDAKS